MRANRTIFRIGKLLFLPSQLGIQTVEIFDEIDSGNRDIRLAGFGKRFPGFPGRPGHVSGGYTLLSIAELYLRPGGNVNNHEKSQRSAFKEHVGTRNPLEPAKRGFSVPVCFSGSIFAFFVVIDITERPEVYYQCGQVGRFIGRTEFKEIDPPKDVQETMNKVVKTENERVAAVDYATARETVADGERRAEINKADGIRQAKILEAQGEA
jgi:hypothetical protein